MENSGQGPALDAEDWLLDFEPWALDSEPRPPFFPKRPPPFFPKLLPGNHSEEPSGPRSPRAFKWPVSRSLAFLSYPPDHLHIFRQSVTIRP